MTDGKKAVATKSATKTTKTPSKRPPRGKPGGKAKPSLNKSKPAVTVDSLETSASPEIEISVEPEAGSELGLEPATTRSEAVIGTSAEPDARPREPADPVSDIAKPADSAKSGSRSRARAKRAAEPPDQIRAKGKGRQSKTKPPAKTRSANDLPVEGKTEPPVENKTEVPAETKTAPPVKSRTEPPVETKTEPPVETKTVRSKTAPPVEGKTAPPVETKTAPPVEGKTAPPVEGKTAPPVEGKTAPPVKTKTAPPVEDKTEPPVEGKTAPPVKTVEDKTAPPVEGKTAPPVKTKTAKTAPPVESKTAPPDESKAEDQEKSKPVSKGRGKGKGRVKTEQASKTKSTAPKKKRRSEPASKEDGQPNAEPPASLAVAAAPASTPSRPARGRAAVEPVDDLDQPPFTEGTGAESEPEAPEPRASRRDTANDEPTAKRKVKRTSQQPPSRRSVRGATKPPTSTTKPGRTLKRSKDEIDEPRPKEIELPDLDEDDEGRALLEAHRAAKVELAPRSSVSIVPSIPIPVKDVPKKPTLDQRAKALEKRISRQSQEFRDRYNESFDMSWIYHDTALEGVVYTYDELTSAFRSDEVTVVDSSVMPIYDAIRRHKAAIEYVRDISTKKRVPLNVELLKRLYLILHPEDGDLKSIKYRRDIPQHRLYFHEYAPPDKIAFRVRQVMDWINQSDTRKSVGILRMAAKAHYDLVRAYPFATDSGKVTRLFMNVLLLRGGLPPAIIHATERQRYYEALKNSAPTRIVKMLQDSVENSISSIEKLLDEHETRKRGFIN